MNVNAVALTTLIPEEHFIALQVALKAQGIEDVGFWVSELFYVAAEKAINDYYHKQRLEDKVKV